MHISLFLAFMYIYYDVRHLLKYLAFSLRFCKTLWFSSQKLAKHYTPDKRNYFTYNNGLETQQDKKHLYMNTFFFFLMWSQLLSWTAGQVKSRAAVLASLLNAGYHSNGPDFFTIDTCDIWLSLLNSSHSTLCRNHGLKEHFAWSHRAQMKITFGHLQPFLHVLSGVSEEGQGY